jgi:hypothetical protein
MNIVQVVRSLELGGLERVALDLATAQKEAGNCVSIYSVYKHEPALIHEADRAGLRVIQFNKLTGFSIRTLWNMARQFRLDQASIVHTHNELVHTYGTIAGRLTLLTRFTGRRPAKTCVSIETIGLCSHGPTQLSPYRAKLEPNLPLSVRATVTDFMSSAMESQLTSSWRFQRDRDPNGPESGSEPWPA